MENMGSLQPVTPDNPYYYKAVGHEMGHYAFWFYEEYLHPDWSIIPYEKRMHTVMANPIEYSELSTPSDYRNSEYDTNTQHWGIYHESCWETFFRKYKNDYGLYFDLNKDGIEDVIFNENYSPLSGPYSMVAII